ncbi:hypothetical protein M8C21_007043 [Ambrosia artemisiifolia]|uniref:Uncharacterized protein n=1 Tax=Ambrosia artemisiifolia TaxID=4212 RepID=A0AAD5G2Q6_AMBAR|nr:hypothetical protein M8C21_007043 [Ambrosia artemisiifolia]
MSTTTTTTSPFCQLLSFRPSFPCTSTLNYKPYTSLNRTSTKFSSSRPFRYNWRFSCFKDENLDYGIPDRGGDTFPGDTVEQQPNRSNVKHDWPSKLRKAVDAIFRAEPWTVPWTAKTILQLTYFIEL